MKSVTNPGFHVKLPFLTSFAEVQVTVQTDSVNHIPCGTSGGVMVNFDKVEVVNRLRQDLVYDTLRNYTIHYDKTWIFDKIHHEINQFCSRHTLQEVYITLFDSLDEHLAQALQAGCVEWAPGIEIISVRVTKPKIPEQIRRNFEQMEAEKTKLLIATEAQKVVEKEAETERKRATIEAQMQFDVSKIIMEKELMQKEINQKVAALEDLIHTGHEHARADGAHYAHLKEAEANQALLTQAYLEYMNILSVANNTKVYFGEKIPSMYIDKGGQ